jgi:hypothetical protein
MASLVLKMSVSLDGYVAPVDGSTDWVAAGGSEDGLSWTVDTVSNTHRLQWRSRRPRLRGAPVTQPERQPGADALTTAQGKVSATMP